MDTRCGFKRGVTRRFEDSAEEMTSRDLRHMLAIARVIDGVVLPEAAE
jgi:hypothetical protein